MASGLLCVRNMYHRETRSLKEVKCHFSFYCVKGCINFHEMTSVHKNAYSRAESLVTGEEIRPCVFTDL